MRFNGNRPPSWSLTTDENLLSHIETRMNGSVLKIETHGQIAPTHGVTVVITSPSLRIELSGAVKLEAAQLAAIALPLTPAAPPGSASPASPIDLLRV
jgi:O-succinylbenzoate synthase